LTLFNANANKEYIIANVDSQVKEVTNGFGFFAGQKIVVLKKEKDGLIIGILGQMLFVSNSLSKKVEVLR